MLGLDVSLLTRIYEEIADAVATGFVPWFMKKLQQVIEFVQAKINETIQGLWKALIPQAIQYVLTTAVTEGVKKIIGFFSGAEIFVQLYNAVMWLVKNWSKILEIIGVLQKVWANVMYAATVSVPQIASDFEEFLASMIVPAIDAVARLMGIASLPNAVKDFLKKLKELAQSPIKALLQGAKSVIDKVIEAIRKAVGWDDLSPIGHPEDAGYQRKVAVDQDGTILIKSSPAQNMNNYAGGVLPTCEPDVRKELEALIAEAKKAIALNSANPKAPLVKPAHQGTLLTVKQLKKLKEKLRACGCQTSYMVADRKMAVQLVGKKPMFGTPQESTKVPPIAHAQESHMCAKIALETKKYDYAVFNRTWHIATAPYTVGLPVGSPSDNRPDVLLIHCAPENSAAGTSVYIDVVEVASHWSTLDEQEDRVEEARIEGGLVGKGKDYYVGIPGHQYPDGHQYPSCKSGMF